MASQHQPDEDPGSALVLGIVHVVEHHLHPGFDHLDGALAAATVKVVEVTATLATTDTTLTRPLIPAISGAVTS